MPLTDMQVRQAKAQLKDYYLTDEKGLRLLVKPNGSKYWRLKYRFLNKQKTLALGVYPVVSLKEAREATIEARRQLAQSVDPGLLRQNERQGMRLNAQNNYSVKNYFFTLSFNSIAFDLADSAISVAFVFAD
ncbi:Arm DNA-binding domain-containing protein [Porticoccus sp.]